ncbi:MAG: methylmalonyl Co-A mutase-associated GTPase MeaB [Myxococcota bacterium]
MAETSWQDLVDRTLAGEPRSLARLVTRVENRAPGWRQAMKALYPHTGKARMLGVTGAPGAGKSSLTNRLAAGFVERGHRVGIIAVDPSSPFSGGALLGDRLRMRDVSTTEGVFIRSMATRGSLGGLCQGARDVGRVLDAAGYDRILIETVGVGQDEIDVFRAAHQVMMICVPGQGDGIQAIKAGVMEIADLFVVNKADRDGADQVVADIRGMLALAGDASEGLEMVFQTDSLSGKGIDELLEALVERLERLPSEPERHAKRAREEILDLVEREVTRRVRARLEADARLTSAVERIQTRRSDPYSAAESLLADFADLEAESHE